MDFEIYSIINILFLWIINDLYLTLFQFCFY